MRSGRIGSKSVILYIVCLLPIFQESWIKLDSERTYGILTLGSTAPFRFRWCFAVYGNIDDVNIIEAMLYFKDTYCIGIQDDWVESALTFQYIEAEHILHGIQSPHANPSKLNTTNISFLQDVQSRKACTYSRVV